MSNNERRLKAAHRALRDRMALGLEIAMGTDYTVELARIALEAADKVDEARHPGHLLWRFASTYGLHHPEDCRADIANCMVDRQLRELDSAGYLRHLALGKYIVGVSDDGILRVEPLPESPECHAADHHKCSGAALDLTNLVFRDCACNCHTAPPAGGGAA